MFQIPDSPMWLLAKGKHLKAHKNLSRLRGNVSYDKCENEFQEMIRYNMPSNNDESRNFINLLLHRLFRSILLNSNSLTNRHIFIDHKENTNTWKQFFKPAVLRPFRLMMIYFFFKNLLCGLPLVPYLVSIFNKFGAPVNVEWTIVSYLQTNL
jgi:MFS transporter, SP family, solute carrier family 2 (facilitated glucose transporter), member 6